MDRMNILFIVGDTLRADHLGCYGYFRDTSPNIDRVAGEGVLFEDFYNAGAPTGPGFTCMYTGLYTIHHRFYRFTTPNIRQVDDTIFTMPEILRALGYTTAALDNLMNQGARAKHFVRGYEFYINCSPDAFGGAARLLAERLNRRLIPWIRDHSGERFFLFVHYWDPHLPYIQPEEYRRVFHHEKGSLSDLRVEEAPGGYKYVPGWGRVGEFPEGEVEFKRQRVSIDLYDGEIRYMDHAIGEVVSTLEDVGVLDDTLILMTADHGEQLNQHYGIWGHAGVHDAVTHIPLIMRCPKRLPRGVKVKGFCQQIDLLPTILDLIGSRTDALEIDGESAMPLLRGERTRDRIFIENAAGLRAVRTDEWKFIADEWARRLRRGPELYNVREDPMEAINLAETNKERAEELGETLRGWVRDNLRGEKDPAIYEDEKELNLRAIEYRHKVARFLESLGIT